MSKMIESAIAQGNTLNGAASARDAMYAFFNAKNILVTDCRYLTEGDSGDVATGARVAMIAQHAYIFTIAKPLDVKEYAGSILSEILESRGLDAGVLSSASFSILSIDSMANEFSQKVAERRSRALHIAELRERAERAERRTKSGRLFKKLFNKA